MKSIEDLIDESQEALVNFLRTDCDLAFTFLETASIEATFDPAACASALDKSRAAVASIRHLSLRVRDAANRSGFTAIADQLETAIAAFPPI